MDGYLLLKTLHVIGATVLFGTGTGIAFFMLMAHRTKDAALIAHTAGVVVLADTIFTASAIVIQPATGLALAHIGGFPLTSGWIALSIMLYLFAGLFWLPVVAIQWTMRNLARLAVSQEAPLPRVYFRLFRIWFVFGFPAFAALVAIIGLMVAKPRF